MKHDDLATYGPLLTHVDRPPLLPWRKVLTYAALLAWALALAMVATV